MQDKEMLATKQSLNLDETCYPLSILMQFSIRLKMQSKYTIFIAVRIGIWNLKKSKIPANLRNWTSISSPF